LVFPIGSRYARKEEFVVAFLTRVFTIAAFVAFVPRAAHAQQYFPPGVFDQNGRTGQFTVDWYSKNLKALREPSLWELSQKDRTAEVYRFLWLRTNDHPVSVRVVMYSKAHVYGRARLFARVASGKAGYDPGRLNRRRHTNVRDGTARKLLERIESVGFWTQPLHAPDVAGVDGARWIIEGIKGGQYHIIDRFSPHPADGDAAYILGSMMVFDVARLRIKKSEIY
jgi:hypothetical protein